MRGSEVQISVAYLGEVWWSVVKCSEVLQWSDVFWFFIALCMVVNYVYFCLILLVMYSYCYVYVFLLLCMLFSVNSVFIVPTAIFRLPWLRFSVLFTQLKGKCQGIPHKDGARPTPFLINKMVFSMEDADKSLARPTSHVVARNR